MKKEDINAISKKDGSSIFLATLLKANPENVEEILERVRKERSDYYILWALRYLVKAKEYELVVNVMVIFKRMDIKYATKILVDIAKKKEYRLLVDIVEITADRVFVSKIVDLFIKAKQDEFIVDIVKIFAKKENNEFITIVLEKRPEVFSRCMQIEYVSRIFKIEPDKE